MNRENIPSNIDLTEVTPNPIEASSFDTNKFDRALIFNELEVIVEQIGKTDTITLEQTEKVLHAMDELEKIGYFHSNDASNKMEHTVLIDRGIDPDKHTSLRDAYRHGYINFFNEILTAIYSAEHTPIGAMQRIYEKATEQCSRNVPGAVGIVMEIQSLCRRHPPEGWTPD